MIIKMQVKKLNLRQDILLSIRELAKINNIDKVILFGSRARGDNKERSDIDLASSGGDFINFSLDVDEKTPTLLMYDFVDLDSCKQSDLLESIRKEGIIIYEKGREFYKGLD